MDPRQARTWDELFAFLQTTEREWARDKDVLAMLRDTQIPSFTIVQEANMAGEYHRFLWPVGADNNSKWWQYVRDWDRSPLAGWEKAFVDIVPEKVYTYEGAQFRATRMDEEGFHVTFYRVS
jgi:hypothetical protein